MIIELKKTCWIYRRNKQPKYVITYNTLLLKLARSSINIVRITDVGIIDINVKIISNNNKIFHITK